MSTDNLDELRAELSRCQVDAVIAATTPGEMSLVPLAAFEIQPRVRVVLVTTDEGVGDLIELRPFRAHLGEVTPLEIVDVVSDDVAHARSWAALAREALPGEP